MSEETEQSQPVEQNEQVEAPKKDIKTKRTKKAKVSKAKAKTKKAKKSKVSKGKQSQTVAFNVSVPKSLLKKIDVAARKSKLPRSAYVRQQLEARL